MGIKMILLTNETKQVVNKFLIYLFFLLMRLTLLSKRSHYTKTSHNALFPTHSLG